MALITPAFLFRISHPCFHRSEMPLRNGERLLALEEKHKIEAFWTMEGVKEFADLRLAWNDRGIGVQLEVRGKDKLPQGSSERPRGSDGLTLWLDTRDSRASHRASRFCHQFHFLPTGGGDDRDEPFMVQARINRALQDAPLCRPSEVPFKSKHLKKGYWLEAFLPASVLNGYDPELNPRLGFYYAVRDSELGEQLLGVGAEFPYWDDPSLWSTLELVR